MKKLLYVLALIIFCTTSTQAQKLVLPTTDVSFNGGLLFKQATFTDSGISLTDHESKPWIANFTVFSNQPYGKHIFELGMAKGTFQLNEGLNTQSTTNLSDFTGATVNYAYMHELFSYYPSCQVANQVYLGIRLNGELIDHNITREVTGGTFTTYEDRDLTEFSLAFSGGTDYNFSDNNYITFQLYYPAIYKISSPTHQNDIADATDAFTVAHEDRAYDADYWTGGEVQFFNGLSKIGFITTYRLMLSDGLGFSLKYHFNNMNWNQDLDAALGNPYETVNHQLTLGILFHSEGGY